MTYKPIRKYHRVKTKRQLWRRCAKSFCTVALVSIICAIGLYNILFSSFFQIGEVTISGNEKIASANLQNSILAKLNRNVVFFSTASIFLLSPAKIETALKEEFPSLEQVKVKRKWPDSIEISVRERQAAAVWCKEAACFLIDTNGVIFEQISDTSGRLVIQSMEYTHEPILGKQVFTNEEMAEIFSLRDLFKAELQIDIAKIFFASPERINVLTLEGWEAYFNFPVDDLRWQITRLKVVLSEEIPAERRPELEYIDLRFSKVYYKYRE